MTQNDFEFIKSALAGKCESLLMEIAEGDACLKQVRQKVEEMKKAQSEEKKDEKDEKEKKENE